MIFDKYQSYQISECILAMRVATEPAAASRKAA